MAIILTTIMAVIRSTTIITRTIHILNIMGIAIICGGVAVVVVFVFAVITPKPLNPYFLLWARLVSQPWTMRMVMLTQGTFNL